MRFAVAAVAAVLFAALAVDLVFHGPVTAADPPVTAWLHDHMHPLATQCLLAVTQMHSTIGLSIMSALLAVVLFATHRGRDIPWLLVTVQGGQVLNSLVKDVFHRARPAWEHPLFDLASSSFPSGHASGSTFFWGFVCVTAWSSPLPLAAKRAIACVAAAMVLATAFSRVYLGAHYLSDVLAGICEGLAWVSLWVIVRTACRSRAGRPSPSRGA